MAKQRIPTHQPGNNGHKQGGPNPINDQNFISDLVSPGLPSALNKLVETGDAVEDLAMRCRFRSDKERKDFLAAYRYYKRYGLDLTELVMWMATSVSVDAESRHELLQAITGTLAGHKPRAKNHNGLVKDYSQVRQDG